MLPTSSHSTAKKSDTLNGPRYGAMSVHLRCIACPDGGRLSGGQKRFPLVPTEDVFLGLGSGTHRLDGCQRVGLCEYQQLSGYVGFFSRNLWKIQLICNIKLIAPQFVQKCKICGKDWKLFGIIVWASAFGIDALFNNPQHNLQI